MVGNETKDTFDPNTLLSHPRRVVGKGKNASTATGRYQTMDFVWDDDTKYGSKGLGLADFKPQSQEILAVGRMMYRGILDEVMRGNAAEVIKRSGNMDASSEWASLQGNPYG
ncbi:MAG: lysozyme family protein, partial [Nostoc sp.]